MVQHCSFFQHFKQILKNLPQTIQAGGRAGGRTSCLTVLGRLNFLTGPKAHEIPLNKEQTSAPKCSCVVRPNRIDVLSQYVIYWRVTLLCLYTLCFVILITWCETLSSGCFLQKVRPLHKSIAWHLESVHANVEISKSEQIRKCYS